MEVNYIAHENKLGRAPKGSRIVFLSHHFSRGELLNFAGVGMTSKFLGGLCWKILFETWENMFQILAGFIWQKPRFTQTYPTKWHLEKLFFESRLTALRAGTMSPCSFNEPHPFIQDHQHDGSFQDLPTTFANQTPFQTINVWYIYQYI